MVIQVLAATVTVVKVRAKDKANVEVAQVATLATTIMVATDRTAVAVDVVMMTIVAATSVVTVVARTTATEISNNTNSVRKLITHLRKSSFVVI